MGSRALNQWALINRTLLVYKISAAALSGAVLIVSVLAFCFATANPVVVTQMCDEKSFYEGHREPVKVTDNDVKRFIEQWVTVRYTWIGFDPEKILKSLSPVSSEGLVKRLREILEKRKLGGSKDQRIEESAANIRVTLTDKDAVAIFDHIIRINGIPIVVASEVSLQIVQGNPTRWNPLGLYVNGIIEHDEEK